jgi:PTH1 family peptidyl-tRNA hydrolase
MTALASEDFARLRIGVGRPDVEGPPLEVSDWVLSRFFDFEKEEVERTVSRAVQALKMIATDGVIAAQNLFN